MADDAEAGPLPSYALFGSGETDPDNAAQLFDDLFPPDDLGVFFRPPRAPRGTSLKAVIDRLETPKLLGPKGTIPSDDLVADLVAQREAGNTVVLIAIWPEEPTEEEQDTVLRARAEGIRVLQLNAALDDLLWEPPAPEPEPEPEAEAVAAAVEEIAEAVTAKVEVALGGDFGATLSALLEQFVRSIVQDEIARKLAAAPAAPSGQVAGEDAVAKVAAKLAGKPDDTPPFGPPYAHEGSADGAASAGSEPYWKSEDGTYRRKTAKANRRRKGEVEVSLTLEEIDRYVRAGKIIDN